MAFGGAKARTRIGKRIKDEQNKTMDLFSLIRRTNTVTSGGVSFTSGAGAGSNKGQSDTNFLPTAGGTMIGPIAFFPRLITIASDAIDISKTTDNFTSRVILSPASGSTDDLVTITGAEHNGQLLFIQGIQTDTITLKNSGNIETIDGNDFDIVDDDIILFQFDVTDNKWQQVTTGKQGIGHTPWTSDRDANGFSLILDPDGDTIIQSASDDTLQFITGGSARMVIFNTVVSMNVDVDLSANDLILDADNDSIISAAVDDNIQFSTGGAARMTLSNTLLTLATTIDLAVGGGQKIKSNSSTEIGIQVNNTSYTVGALGTIGLPTKNASVPSGASAIDTDFGTLPGAVGVYINTTLNTSVLVVRQSDGAWSGVSMTHNLET